MAREPRREATNLSVPGDLVTRARALGLNLSAVFEAALTAAVRTRERERWLEENRSAIDAYNEHVEADGVFSDQWRTF